MRGRAGLCAMVVLGGFLLSPRPSAAADFSYSAPGDLIPGTGSGRVDCSVYASGIGFPLEVLPGYANSQVHNPGGQVAGSECTPSNYNFPWRDTFCETRSNNRSTPLCPAQTSVHQGVDIRPSTCADNTHWVVSATNGTVTHIPDAASWWVNVTASDGSIYSYLHMKSIQVAVGQSVSKGQRLGRVSDAFGVTPTTFHLHFEVYKSVLGFSLTPVPPYMSLVQSYRSLIGSLSSGVRVHASANLNVRNSAGGTSLGLVSAGTTGTITGSSTVANFSNLCWIWWPVQWDNGLTGWSVDNFMVRDSSCSFTLSPTSRSFGSGGGSNSFSVQTQSGCAWSSNTTSSWITITSGSGSGNGTVQFSVAANSSTSSRSGTIVTGGKTFTVEQAGASAGDTTNPSTSITDGPSGTVSTGNATFTYTGSDNVTSTGNLQFAYRLDPIEPSFSAFSSQTSRSYSNLGNGSYTFFVKARDQAGNEDSTPASRSFTVQTQTSDAVPPNTSITSGPSGTVTTGNVSFTYTGSDNVTPSGSLQFAYRLEPIESSFSAFSSQTSRPYSNLANGTYTFHVKAMDQAGNQDSTPATQTFTIGVAPPPTGNRAKAADFDGDGHSDWVVYRNGTWLYFGPCAHPLNQRGTLIDPICSPCAQAVCDADSYCCDTEWDGICVSEFNEFCR